VPFALLLGCLVGLVAANLLRRQVAEPLQQLAETTRVNGAPQQAEHQSGKRRNNELTALAANFDALADRLAEYERELVTVRHSSGQQIIERTRELEARLRKAEALTRSKDEFLANMSHEIRTPMNGVLGMAELLAGTELDKRNGASSTRCAAAAETMMQIINDILDDSKIEAARWSWCARRSTCASWPSRRPAVLGQAERKKLEMICRIEPTVPSVVAGDALRLRQVLGNLLSNAVKYTEHGEVEIRVGLDDMRDGQCRLHFSVRDTGPASPTLSTAAYSRPLRSSTTARAWRHRPRPLDRHAAREADGRRAHRPCERDGPRQHLLVRPTLRGARGRAGAEPGQ